MTVDVCIADLVERLPDSYQKVFNHPEYDDRAFRDCDDRWRHVERLLDAHPTTGRPLHVLDIGCSLGYFALKAAAKGCRVTAIDTSAPNIELCRALAEESGLEVDFRLCSFDEEFVSSLADGEFDVTLIFSVLQHICHERGVGRCTTLMDALARKTGSLVAELALPSEPVYWAASLPANPVSLLAAFPFCKKVGEHPTHLSSISRPLCFASRKLTLVEGRPFEFERVQIRSHELVGNLHRNSRRYFFGKHVCVKVYQLNSILAQANRTEFRREVDLLSGYAGRLPWLPRLLAHESDGEQLCLARELLPGDLLSTRIASAEPFDAWRVVSDLLACLVDLEDLGLYHNDLRTWNVVIGPDGRSRLIDFGAISTERQEDVFDAFLSFCYCVANKTQPAVPDVLTLRRSADWFPEEWRSRILAVTALSAPALSFRGIREIFSGPQAPGSNDATLQERANVANIRKLEEAVNRLLEAFPPSQVTARQFQDTLIEWNGIIQRIDARQASSATRSLPTQAT